MGLAILGKGAAVMFFVKEDECLLMNEIVLGLNADANESDKKLRLSFLSRIQDLIFCDQASFYLPDPQRDNITDPVSLNIDRLYLDAYERYYRNIDEAMPYIHMTRPNTYRYTDILNGKAKQLSETYNDFFKPMGACYSQGVNLVWNNHFLGLVVLFRGIGEQDFTDRDMFILRQFQGHLSHKLYRLLVGGQSKNHELLNKNVLREKYHLSEREIEIVDLVLSGHHNRDISDKLFIELSTVKTHLKRIFVKLNISSRTQILSLLMEGRARSVSPD